MSTWRLLPQCISQQPTMKARTWQRWSAWMNSCMTSIQIRSSVEILWTWKLLKSSAGLPVVNGSWVRNSFSVCLPACLLACVSDGLTTKCTSLSPLPPSHSCTKICLHRTSAAGPRHADTMKLKMLSHLNSTRGSPLKLPRGRGRWRMPASRRTDSAEPS